MNSFFSPMKKYFPCLICLIGLGCLMLAILPCYSQTADQDFTALKTMDRGGGQPSDIIAKANAFIQAYPDNSYVPEAEVIKTKAQLKDPAASQDNAAVKSWLDEADQSLDQVFQKYSFMAVTNELNDWLFREQAKIGDIAGMTKTAQRMDSHATPNDKKRYAVVLSAGEAFADGLPDFDENSIDNIPISTKANRGKVLVLDFWATWCGPCRAELPHVKDIYAKYHDQGLEIIGISGDNMPLKDLSDWLQQNGIVWKQFCDQQAWHSKLFQLYGVPYIPYTIVIDRRGNLAGLDMRGRELEERVVRLIAQKAE